MSQLKRDYTHSFDHFVQSLACDVYPQPPDPLHTAWGIDVVERWSNRRDINTVLDVGCGQGFLKPVFEKMGKKWIGVTIGKDYEVCHKAGFPVHNVDISFLPWRADSFDLIFARHVLEHSPFPIITLMEWFRVATKCLILVVPTPEYVGYKDRNHYSVAPKAQVISWLDRAGWKIEAQNELRTTDEVFARSWYEFIHEPNFPPAMSVEFQFLCTKY